MFSLSAFNGMEALSAEVPGRAVLPRKGVQRTRMRVLRALRRDERGQGLVEYALIIVLIAVVCIASLNYFGQKTNNSLSNTANTVGNVLS